MREFRHFPGQSLAASHSHIEIREFGKRNMCRDGCDENVERHSGKHNFHVVTLI